MAESDQITAETQSDELDEFREMLGKMTIEFNDRFDKMEAILKRHMANKNEKEDKLAG
jgi:hypothetical protein